MRLEDQGRGSVKLAGVRSHPEPRVAEPCGKRRRKCAIAITAAETCIGPPDVALFAYREAMAKDGPAGLSADATSIATSARNDDRGWTFTASPASPTKTEFDDPQVNR